MTDLDCLLSRTIARNFSNTLNSAFSIDSPSPALEGLQQSVEQKKQALNSQSAELQALEARLKETEQRLKERQSRTSSPTGRAAGHVTGAMGTTHPRKPIGTTFDDTSVDTTRPQSQEGASSAQPVEASEAMVDGTIGPPDGTENPSAPGVMASTRSRWMPESSAVNTSSSAGVRHTDASVRQ